MFKSMVIIISLRNNGSYVKMLYKDKVLYCAKVQNKKLPVVDVKQLLLYFYRHISLYI